MIGIKDLLLNMLFIILSVFTFEMFWIDKFKPIEKKKKQRVYLINAVCALCIVLCMSFPVTNFSGYIYDLRKIPLVFGIFYGGYFTGIFLMAFMLVYRTIIGGHGVLGSFLFYPLFIYITSLVRAKFQKGTLRQKLFLSSSLTGGLSFLQEILGRLFGMAAPFTDESISIFLLYCLMNVITTCLSVYLIERSIEHRKMQTQIQQAEKSNVLGELTASIAHEIRNPMTAARGFMQLIREQAKDHKSLSYVDIAIAEIDRAEVIISDYLEFAKPQMDEINRIDLRLLIENVLSIVSPYAAFNSVEIKPSLKPSLFIEGNSGKLLQCLVNVIKNAIEASSGNGQVQVSTEQIGTTIWIRIVDNGIGMDEVEIRRLGCPFYSTKEKGTGLGLMASYRIIQMMNGKIEVESEKGKGTCFSFVLPTATEKT